MSRRRGDIGEGLIHQAKWRSSLLTRRRPAAKMPVPAVSPDDAAFIPLCFRDLTEADKRGIIAAYHTSVAFLDRQIGRVLEAASATSAGREPNTLVIYLGDHGYNLGHHGRFEKHCFNPAIVGFRHLRSHST